MRIGLGFDIHPLVSGRRLFLGGIEIPHQTGLLGHSDADVVIHALCDALLGAIGQGDLGEHFPDADPRYEGISSLILLQSVMGMLQQQRYQIWNLDVVILADHPKLSPYKEGMRGKIAEQLGVKEKQVNIKASSSNGLSFRAEGKESIAAYCVVLLREEDV
ncbi:MAG: 2-C-methyl-D-erythritol 2,4-cyclodiphosphate synthase [bacterium]